MLDYIRSLMIVRNSEKGQDLAEYALLIGLLALVVIVAVTILGTNLNTLFQDIATEVGTWF